MTCTVLADSSHGDSHVGSVSPAATRTRTLALTLTLTRTRTLTLTLGHAGATRLLEIETAGKAFCGWDTRMPGNAERMATFTRVADGLLETVRLRVTGQG